MVATNQALAVEVAIVLSNALKGKTIKAKKLRRVIVDQTYPPTEEIKKKNEHGHFLKTEVIPNEGIHLKILKNLA